MDQRKIRFAFLVQGEGRGHMTQAIVLNKWLIESGHQLVHTFVGKSKRRQIPDYFTNQITSDVQPLASPNFVLDRKNKSLKLAPTIFYNLRFLRTYYHSLKEIDRKLQGLHVDVLINFYDFLGGFYSYFFRPKTKHVVIGHQFLAGHPRFPFAKGRPFEKRLFLINNALTSLGACKKIALSFRPYQPLHHKTIAVVPPLMRDEIKFLNVETGDFILAYMVNDGYGEEIMEWHRHHRDQKVHVFWDRRGVPNTYRAHENLVFHQIDHRAFIDFMRRCKGYVSTAGFESICEAMYLGKPVLMIPVQSQYEQACNGIDAVKAGAGITGDHFDISQLLEYMEDHPTKTSGFKDWESTAKTRIIEELSKI